MKERIIVALDTDSPESALAAVRSLSGEVGMFKVGMELFPRGGPELVRRIREAGGDVFLDLKFHSDNGAVIIMQHGYKSTRDELLNEAQMLYRHGYGALITSIRAHDYSEGEMITFGMYEVNYLEAWYQYLIARNDIYPDRIGMLGNSFGGRLAIQYTARNENIKVVVAHSAFSSLNDTVATSVEFSPAAPASASTPQRPMRCPPH